MTPKPPRIVSINREFSHKPRVGLRSLLYQADLRGQAVWGILVGNSIFCSNTRLIGKVRRAVIGDANF
jgi:hypothetical protein